MWYLVVDIRNEYKLVDRRSCGDTPIVVWWSAFWGAGKTSTTGLTDRSSHFWQAHWNVIFKNFPTYISDPPNLFWDDNSF